MTGDPGRLRFAVLGPLRGWRDDRELDLGWPKQRTVLAVLVLAAGQPVSRAELVDAVWADEPPASSNSLVHTYLGRIRRALDPGRRDGGPQGLTLTGGPAGYALHLAPGDVDLSAFRGHLKQARRQVRNGAIAAAVEGFDTALGLWSGTPLAGIVGTWADAQRVRLSELRLSVVEEWAAAMLGLGRHTELVPELTALAAEHPLRERLRVLLMTALFHGGRQADALAVYAAARRQLVEELGIEPSAELRHVQRRILASGHDRVPVAGRPTRWRPNHRW